MKCFYACLIPVIWFCGSPLLAQHTLVLKNKEADIAISPHAYVYTGRASPLAIDTLVQSDTAGFILNTDTQEINYGLDQPRAWCIFFIRNESGEQDWVLKIQHSRVDTIQLYVVRENKMIERFPMTGHFQTLSKRPVHSLPFAYTIKIKKNEKIACYLFSARQYGRHAAIATIMTKDRFESYEYGFNVVLGFVCGMVVLASFLGFFLFLFVRQRLYLMYSIYAASFLFVLLADTGFAHALLFLPLDQTVANGFTMVAYYWMGGCLGIFTLELLQLKQQARPDVVLVDFNMPHLNGIELTKFLISRNKEMKVLILSMYNEEIYIETFRRSGSKGYIFKTASVEEVVSAIHKVHSGKFHFPPSRKDNIHAQDFFLKKLKLSSRELEVIKLVKEGLTTKEIANRLNISFYTAETHRKNIKLKIGVEGEAAFLKFVYSADLEGNL